MINKATVLADAATTATLTMMINKATVLAAATAALTMMINKAATRRRLQ